MASAIASSSVHPIMNSSRHASQVNVCTYVTRTVPVLVESLWSGRGWRAATASANSRKPWHASALASSFTAHRMRASPGSSAGIRDAAERRCPIEWAGCLRACRRPRTRTCAQSHRRWCGFQTMRRLCARGRPLAARARVEGSSSLKPRSVRKRRIVRTRTYPAETFNGAGRLRRGTSTARCGPASSHRLFGTRVTLTSIVKRSCATSAVGSSLIAGIARP